MNISADTVTEAAPRILLVDDDRLVLATLAEGLRRAGYEVIEAQSGEEGQVCAREMQPDIAILDMRMPGLSGLELARWLEGNTTIPYLFLSAYSDAATVADAVGGGALGYLVKPLDVQQLIPALEAALARGRDIRALENSSANLEAALQQGRQISTAVGVIMERYRIGEREAFARLRSKARSERGKVSTLAEEIVQACEQMNGLDAVPKGPNRVK